MVQVKDLTEITIKELWKEVKDEEEWWGDVERESLRMVKRLLEGAMEGEMLEQLRAGRFQNSASVDRIIYGMITHLNQTWQDKPLVEFTHFT